MSFNKRSIKDALVDAKEIEKFAFESAKKTIEESMAPQLEQVLRDTIKEIEASVDNDSEIVEEAIKLEIAADADMTVKVDEAGQVTIGGDSENTTIDNSNPDTEMNNTPQEEEMFEIEGLFEDGADVAPVADATTAPAETIAEPADTGNEAMLTDMAAKLDILVQKIAPESANAGGGEGEVQVVDDDNSGMPAAPAAPAAPTAAAPAPAMPGQDVPVNEDDIMFEIDDDISSLFETDVVTEDSLDEINLDELDSIDEIEIVDEDEEGEEGEEMVDEMRGLGHTVNRGIANRKHFVDDNKLGHAPVGHMNENIEQEITEIKAQYESKIDELIQENARLKGAVKEYKDSFVELRQQVNEMQVFNGKLAYANRLLTNGGVSAEEKMTIAEAFDKVDSVEDAKKLYNKLIKEMQATKSISSPMEKLKATAQPMVEKSKDDLINESHTQTLYESPERRRMRELMNYSNQSKKS